MLDRIRQLPAIPGKQIWIPGDREYRLLAQNRQRGVEVDEKTYAQMKTLGEELGVTLPGSR